MRDTAHGWRAEAEPPKYPSWVRVCIIIGPPLIAWLVLGAAAVALWGLLS